MRPTKLLTLSSLLTALLAFGGSATCFGQGTRSTTAESSHASPAQDSELAKRLEIALIQLEASEAREAIQKQRLSEKDATIKALEDGSAQRDFIIQQFKERRDASDKVDTGDARMLARCDQQVLKAEARIQALEHPPFLSRLLNPDVVLAGVGGFGLGRLTAPGQGPIQVVNPFLQFQGAKQLQMPLQQSDSDRAKQALRQMRVAQ